MIAANMFDESHLAVLKRALASYSLRHRVVADNLSNINTPGYRAQQVDFETALADASRPLTLKGFVTERGHLPLGVPAGPVPAEIAPLGEEFDNGINDVNVDREMGELVKNDLAYRLSTRLLARRYQGLRTAITGRT